MNSLTLFNTLEEEKKSLIEQHLHLVLDMNKTMNLTRIESFEEGMLLHVEDSLQALEEMKAAPQGLYGDLGSGGGFPGIPLGVACNRETVLIDAREKKMKAMAQIIEEIGLESQFSTFSGRAELLARKQPKRFSVLTARALAKLPVLLELASPLLCSGGYLICFKANLEQEELDDADYVTGLVGMKKISDRRFQLGDEYSRRIVVFEKVGPAKVKLPRSEGMAQKEPLSNKRG